MHPSIPLHRSLTFTLSILAASTTLAADAPAPPKHNVILFVSDGLRHGAVDTVDPTGKPFMPTFAELRKNGVNFTNSHSLFPTITTPNASAIATGHYIGDTGDFGNNLFLNYSVVGDAWDVAHAVESDTNIPDFNQRFGGNYLGEESLIARARRAGFHTAIIGKLGPALVQDVTLNNPNMMPDTIQTIFFDDATGTSSPTAARRGAVPLPNDFALRFKQDDYFKTTYFDGQEPSGDPRTVARTANNTAGTKVANAIQQKYFADVLTKAVLPSFVDPTWGAKPDGKPFVVVYWSRDPDGTQHNQQDGPGIIPGINGPTVHAAFQNADNNLKQLVEYLKITLDPNAPGKTLADTTNIFITADHGFSTVARGISDPAGTKFQTFASQQHYSGIAAGQFPRGFIAIDLAHDLSLPLYDNDSIDTRNSNLSAPKIQYKLLKLDGPSSADLATHPGSGVGLIGGTGTYDKDGYNTSLIAIPGMIYVPPPTPQNPQKPDDIQALIRKTVASLAGKPYISGIFVDTDKYGDIPGALSLADINMKGSAKTPLPAIMYSVRGFSTDPANPEMTGVMLSDSGEKTGGGSHGDFGRDDTYNCMIAFGPDFKKSLQDTDPVSNADIAITLSTLMGIDLRQNATGKLTGRVLAEALATGPAPKGAKSLEKRSQPTDTGIVTLLKFQTLTDDAGKEYRYFDAAGFPGQSVGLPK